MVPLKVLHDHLKASSLTGARDILTGLQESQLKVLLENQVPIMAATVGKAGFQMASNGLEA